MKHSALVVVCALALIPLTLSMWAPQWVSAVVMSAAAAAFSYAWPYVLRIPAKRTVSTVGALTSVAAICSVLVADPAAPLLFVSAAIGLGVALSFIVQLLRGTGQVRRLDSLMGLSAGLLLSGSGAGWVAAADLASKSYSTALMTQPTTAQGAALTVTVVTLLGLLVPLIHPRIQSSTPIVVLVEGLFFGAVIGSVTELRLLPGLVLGLITAALLASALRMSADFGAEALTKRVALGAGLAGVGLLGGLVYFSSVLASASLA